MLTELLDRLFPHDTLMIGGQPYMRRWYVFGYAPDPDDVDRAMICATCRLPVQWIGGSWFHMTTDAQVHPAVAVSAPRGGWRWSDHGLGAFRIHQTLASDDSRAFHDHPWPFVSIGIRGSYTEVTPYGPTSSLYLVGADPQHTWPDVGAATNPRRTFRAPFVNRKAATDLHCLVVERGPVWTLFFTRPKVRSWGFGGPFGWLPWRQFDAEFPERDAWTQQ